MKMGGAKKVHYDSGPNMTPLVDVVMVILIFLMLTGTFSGATFYLRSNLPPLGGEKATGDKDPFGKVQIDIRVAARGDQLSAFVSGSREITSQDALQSHLEGLKRTFRSQGKKDDDIQVIISPDPWVKYQVLVQVHSAALLAQLPKVAFKTSAQ